MAFFRVQLKSKIHDAVVTGCSPDYIGSITIDAELLEKAGIWEGERVLVADKESGERLETYAIAAKPGSGIIRMNGAAAKKIHVGHRVIVMAFGISEKRIAPKAVLVGKKNRFVRFLSKKETRAGRLGGE